MYVLPWISVVTMGHHMIHLMYVLVTNLRVPPINLCIGLGTRFRLHSPVETSGSPCSPLCGLSIMNMNLLFCYSSTNSRIDRTGKIALCYFSTNS